MHSQQPQGIVRLKIPASVKSKGKRPTQEPLTQIQHFFSNSNTRQRNQSQKDELLRGPPTPNLEFIKQNKMRQAAQSSGHAAKLVIHKSLNEYDDIDDEATTHHSSRVVCPSHPNKKAKYFLASNTNVRFCTKCAITMAEREPILDEEKYHKITEIDKFRETIKIVKQDILQREPQARELSQKLEEGYRKATSEIDEHFDIIYQTIKTKHHEVLKTIQAKYNNSKTSLKAYRQDIDTAGNAMDKYLFDVNRNYEDIVQDLSTSHFTEIMDQYQAKICDYMEKVSNPPMCQFATQTWVARLSDIKDTLRRVSLEDRPHISRSPLQRKQNIMQYTNQPTLKNKSKTPDRLTR